MKYADLDHLDTLDGPDAQQSDRHTIDSLFKLATWVAKPGVVFCEVGSWLGHTTRILAGIAKDYNGKVYCVDTWCGCPSQYGLVNAAKGQDIFALFRKHMEQLGFWDTVVPIMAKSQDVVKGFADQAFDFVYLDADHTYEPVKNDIISYLPKAKTLIGGHECAHKYGSLPSDVRQLVDNNKHLNWIPDPIIEDCGIHPGVVIAVGEVFDNKDYAILPGEVWISPLAQPLTQELIHAIISHEKCKSNR